jgi:N-methylhydantoinase A
VVTDVLTQLADEGRALVRAAGVAAPAVTYAVDMRHVGQGHEIQVALADAARPDAQFREQLRAAFAAAYETLYGRGLLAGADVEVITWRARCAGPREPFSPTFAAEHAAHGGRHVASRLVRRGGRLRGHAGAEPLHAAPRRRDPRPVIVEQRESTVVVGPSAVAQIDAHRNLVMTLA